jgi:Fe-S oxidoreductase
VGTEGTCVVVTEATLRLVHIPAHRRLVVLGFRDVFQAADAVPRLLERPLQGLEGFDDVLVRQMRARPLNVEHLPLLPEGGAWLYAELAGDTPAEADDVARSFVDSLPMGQVHRRFDDPADQARLWLIRESGLGATAIRPDGIHNLEGWEDAAVPPDRLGDYLRALTALWREFGYEGALYGHFGQGCVHTRNDFEVHTTAGRARFRAFVERAADLVVSLGGSLSGEHGDGQARGELLTRMYGPTLMDAFRAYTAIWDPRGRMNPGKLIDARPLDADLRLGDGGRASALAADRPGGLALVRDRGSLQAAAERCVGVGRCRREDAGVMCPSFRVTRLEQHSTRGRAKLLAEMFRGDVTPESWRNRDVLEVLDLCLSCKGCRVDCPTGVDVARYKAEFLHQHYRHRLRPRSAYLMGTVPLTARVATRMPRFINGLLQAPVVGRAVLRAGGITTRRPPIRFAAPSFRRSALARAPERRDRLDATVVVWPDSFTDAFDPGLGHDIVRLLEATGERVAVPSGWGCCGRPLYDSGMLGVARGWLRRLIDVLDPWTSQGIPVVVPEPSCLSAFRDELPDMLADDPRSLRLAQLARSPAEHLLARDGAERLAALDPNAGAGQHLVMHPHCQGRAVGSTVADAGLARRLGFDVTVLDAGCCGLAGSFGFRAEHEPLSRAIGSEQWLPAIDAALGQDPATLVIDGFSCRTQLAHLGDREAATLAGTVLAALADRAGNATSR